MQTLDSHQEALLLTSKQVAGVLGVGLSKVKELIATRELASVQIGRCRRIPRWVVEDYVGRLVACADIR